MYNNTTLKNHSTDMGSFDMRSLLNDTKYYVNVSGKLNL